MNAISEITTEGKDAHAALMSWAASPLQGLAIADGADAMLISLCDQFCAHQRRVRSFYDDGPAAIPDDDEREAAIRAIKALQAPLLGGICENKPTTVAGFTAVAKAMVLCDPWFMESIGTVEDRLLDLMLEGMQAHDEMCAGTPRGLSGSAVA